MNCINRELLSDIACFPLQSIVLLTGDRRLNEAELMRERWRRFAEASDPRYRGVMLTWQHFAESECIYEPTAIAVTSAGGCTRYFSHWEGVHPDYSVSESFFCRREAMYHQYLLQEHYLYVAHPPTIKLVRMKVLHV